MKEYKFRGKRIDNGEWAYGYYSPLKVPLIGIMGHFINERGHRAIEVDPETVGQYIGICDINKVEIYEGDKVKFWYEELFFEGHIEGIVQWNPGGFYILIPEKGVEISFHDIDMDFSMLEVINDDK